MNPNSNPATTARMVAIAARDLPDVRGWTAPSGTDLLTTKAHLAAAAASVAAAEIPDGTDGVIVSAFGDPGRAALAARLGIPVVGIGEAAAWAAAAGGRRFAVVTHTPGIVGGIDALMRGAAPGGAYLGTVLTEGDPVALTADAAALDAALLAATHRAQAAGAEAVIIGGGPLAAAAERLQPVVTCALILPVPEAARHMRSRLHWPT